MEIELTDELMVELVKLKMLRDNDNFEDFSIAVRHAAKKLEVKENVILKMLFSEDFLHKVVVKKTTLIDNAIKEKEEELVNLKSNKFAYGNLICNLYGHNPVRLDENGSLCYCENCGRLVHMSSLQAEHEKGLQNKKIYKEKCNNESITRK